MILLTDSPIRRIQFITNQGDLNRKSALKLKARKTDDIIDQNNSKYVNNIAYINLTFHVIMSSYS